MMLSGDHSDKSIQDLAGKNRTERQEIIVGSNKFEAQQVISFQFWSEEKFEAQHCYTMEY